jgi:hypothetical protein
MKKSLVLIFGALIALPALSQTKINGVLDTPRPSVEAVTGAVWNQKIIIQPQNNTYYEWIIESPNDTLRHFDPAGKRYKARTVFTEILDEPVIDIVEVDNSSFSFSPSAAGNVNQVNAQGWSQFDSDIAPNPDWCEKFLQGSCSFSDLTGATIIYTFVGKRIEVWGEKSDNKGIAGFKIDNIAEQLKDLYAPVTSANAPREIIFEADFPQGTHQITIRVSGNKTAASTGKFVLADHRICTGL